jgi:hypothetical protein
MGFFNSLGGSIKSLWNKTKNAVVPAWNSISNGVKTAGSKIGGWGNRFANGINSVKDFAYTKIPVLSPFIKKFSESTGIDGKINNVSNLIRGGGNLISSISRGDFKGGGKSAIEALNSGGSMLGLPEQALSAGREMINTAERAGTQAKRIFNQGSQILQSADEGINNGFTPESENSLVEQGKSLLNRIRNVPAVVRERPMLRRVGR